MRWGPSHYCFPLWEWPLLDQNNAVSPANTKRWDNVGDTGPISIRHWLNISCLLWGLLGKCTGARLILGRRRIGPATSSLQLSCLQGEDLVQWLKYTEHCAACARHRLHACIKMRTALPANTRPWPNVVSLLVQRRWRWANSETALGQILAFAGLHTGVCLHPPLPHHNILASRSGYF